MRFRRHGTRSPQRPSPGSRRRATLLAATAALAGVTAAPAVAANAAPPSPRAAAAPSVIGRAPLSLAQAMAEARHSRRPVQVTGATTITSTLTANPNGTLTATESMVPVRKETGGRWVSLDATLRRDASGSVAPAATLAGVVLSGGGTGPLARVTDGAYGLSMTFPRPLPAPALSGATATYPGVLRGVDLAVTVTTEGSLDAVLVVRDAGAARNPALRKLTFRTSVTAGLTIRARADGELAAVNRAGRVVFDEPAPRMWDSRVPARAVPTAVRASTGQRVDLRTGQPATSGTAAPGEAARAAPVGVRYAGGAVTYTPDASLLDGPATAYPVYIDPGIAQGGTEQYWADTNSYYHSQAYPKPTPDMQVGYEGWCYPDPSNPSVCGPTFTARSYVTMTLPQLLWGTPAADIYSATFYISEDIAPACMTSFPNNDFGVRLYRTRYVGPTALPTWDSPPASNALEDTKAFSLGTGGCSGNPSVGFSVLEAARWAAGASTLQPTITFGLQADSETDQYGWKEFLPNATMSITFDKPPTVNTFSTSPGTHCAKDDTIGKGDVLLEAWVHSPFGTNASLTPTFYASKTSGGQPVSGLNPATPAPVSNDTPVHALIPEATLNSLAGSSPAEFTWYVTVSDGTLTNITTTYCHFTYDPTTPGAPHVTAVESSWSIGTDAHFTVTPPDNPATGQPESVSGYNYQLNGSAPAFQAESDTSGDAKITVRPTARTEVLSVTAVSAGGNDGSASFTVPFPAQPPATAQADGDLTGDGIPDLVVPGGTPAGLAPGLWLAQGQPGRGQASGDGQLSASLTDIGAEGNGLAGDYSPADFTGSQVITGLFDNSGFQDTLTYYPPGSGQTHQGVVLFSNGDGTITSDKAFYTNAPDSGDTVAVNGLDTFDQSDKTSGGIQNATADAPLQVANAYHAETLGTNNPPPSPVSVTVALPDLITINGHNNTSTTTNVKPGGGQLSYYLEYYPDGSEPGAWGAGSMILDATNTPDGSMDWNSWQIATMAEPPTQAYPYGAIDMFLYKPSTGDLWLWQNLSVTPDTNYQWASASYTPYQLASSTTSACFPTANPWHPVGTTAGATLAALRAADITASGPALWAVSSTGQATPWYASGLTGPAGTCTTGTGTISTPASSAQSLLSPTHAWRLGDGTDDTTAIGTTSTSNPSDISPPAADTGTGGSTGTQLTAPAASANVTWNDQAGLFSPAADFNNPAVTDTTKNPGTVIAGSDGYLSEATASVLDDNGNYTVSAWVKPAVLGGAILSQSSGGTSCYMLYIDTTTISGITYGRWNFRLSNADHTNPTWYTATAGDTHYAKLGAWAHLTVTYDSASKYLRLYVNGIPAAAVIPSVTWSGHCSTFSLGQYILNGASHGAFTGEIANVEAWDGTTLTPTEVADISGTPGYTLFPANSTHYAPATSQYAWQWKAQCGNMDFYNAQINIQQTCTGKSIIPTGTAGTSSSYFTLQGSDGNLVIYDSGRATWSSGTQGNPGDVMFFQPDGNLAIYSPNGNTLWSANTQNMPFNN